MTLTQRLGLLALIVSSSVSAGCIAESAPAAGASDGGTQCTGTTNWDWVNQPSEEIPWTVYLNATGTGSGTGTGTATFALVERVTDGWRVSLVDGDLPVPAVLQDSGVLSSFAPGDRVEVTARTDCQPFSGCKSFVVVRDARDHALITASFRHDASALPDFAAALGIPLTLEAVCSFPPAMLCYEDAVETRYGLRLGTESIVELQRHTHAPMTIGDRKYTAWLGAASTVAGDKLVSSIGGCLDKSSFWARGGVEFEIVP